MYSGVDDLNIDGSICNSTELTSGQRVIRTYLQVGRHLANSCTASLSQSIESEHGRWRSSVEAVLVRIVFTSRVRRHFDVDSRTTAEEVHRNNLQQYWISEIALFEIAPRSRPRVSTRTSFLRIDLMQMFKVNTTQLNSRIEQSELGN